MAGGKRLGAGRKRGEPTRVLSVRVTAAQAERLADMGGGSAAAGLRELVERGMVLQVIGSPFPNTDAAVPSMPFPWTPKASGSAF